MWSVFYYFLFFMMNTIITPFTDSSRELVDCYIAVFGEAPWNEWYISEISWVLYPLSTVDFGDDEVRPYYDPQELNVLWQSWSSKQWFTGQLAQVLQWDEVQTIWFIAGWKTTLSQLNDEKLWIGSDIWALSDAISRQFPWFDEQKLRYAADLWVLSDYRDQWVARELYDARQSAMIQQWAQRTIVRTIKWLAKPYQWYIDRCGFVPVYDYNDEQNRTILVAKLPTNEDY